MRQRMISSRKHNNHILIWEDKYSLTTPWEDKYSLTTPAICNRYFFFFAIYLIGVKPPLISVAS